MLGDSYLSEDRVKLDIDANHPRDTIEISPHATTSADRNDPLSNRIVVAMGAFIANYSVGGCTLSELLKDEERLEKWAREVPELLVLHAGACDIANKNRYNVDNIKKLFLKDLSDFIKQWPVEARKTLKDNAR